MSLHRGRIQAQGEKLEESESWAQAIPPTVDDGLAMADKLKNKIPPKEASIREGTFEDVRVFIRRAGLSGGVDAPVSKVFKVKETRHERVDLEVKKGRAFIPVNLRDDG